MCFDVPGLLLRRVQEAAVLKDQLDEKTDKYIKLEDQTQELAAQIEPLREALRKVVFHLC